ncbi:MAG: hypothetical protein Q4F41_16120 [Eubacteriales bacterium]|nr:hypothetical protein [Eubacteriales bacterium]
MDCEKELEKDRILRNLYVNMIKEDSSEKISCELQKEVLSILKEHEGLWMTEKEELIKDMGLLIASAAEESGFIKGFQCAVCLFLECIRM